MPPGSSPSPEAAQKQNSCPPPSTSFPEVPWEEAKEPPWLLIHPAASPRSPHPTWGSSAPPCQHPHPGSELAGCHFQHLHRASHSFPRKQEEDFQGGASGDKSSSPTCYPSNQIPPSPHRFRLPKGQMGLRQRLKGAPFFLGKAHSVLSLLTCPHTPSPASQLWT